MSSVSSLAVEPSGQLLYAFEVGGRTIQGFTINSSGALAPVSQFPPIFGAFAYFLATDSAGKFLFGCWAPSFVAYTIDSNSGTLTSVPGSPFQFPTLSSGASAFVVYPSGHFLYVTTFSNTVAGLTVAADGTLGLVPGSPIATGTNPVNMAVDPFGRFLYVANNGDGTISGFSVDSNSGVLTSIAGSPFSAGTNSAGLPKSPYDLVIDSRGKFLYVSDDKNAAMLTFSIAPTGELVKQPDTLSLASTSFVALVEEH
jgi:6-phosphogluconolactonase (cycloisomerase 2 family)